MYIFNFSPRRRFFFFLLLILFDDLVNRKNNEYIYNVIFSLSLEYIYTYIFFLIRFRIKYFIIIWNINKTPFIKQRFPTAVRHDGLINVYVKYSWRFSYRRSPDSDYLESLINHAIKIISVHYFLLNNLFVLVVCCEINIDLIIRKLSLRTSKDYVSRTYDRSFFFF